MTGPEREALLGPGRLQHRNPPVLCDDVRNRFSIDTLVAMLGRAGLRIQIVVGRRSNVA